MGSLRRQGMTMACAAAMVLSTGTARADWSPNITNVIQLVYCMVGGGSCEGLQPGIDTVEQLSCGAGTVLNDFGAQCVLPEDVAGGDPAPPVDSWTAGIGDIMDLVYCIVGLDTCVGLEPGLDTLVIISCGEGTVEVGGACVAVATPTCAAAPTVVLEVYPLDIWAQTIDDATVTVTGVADGLVWEGPPGAAIAVPICTLGDYEVTVTAPHHEALSMTLDFDGYDDSYGLWIWDPPDGMAHVYTSDVRDYEGIADVRHFTLWGGLAHRWFAPSGFPARSGTHVSLMGNGEEAWEAVATDLSWAWDQVLMSSWWWQSDFELERDPWSHPWMSETERAEYTVMSRLEDLWWVPRKILINQFMSQDGLFSQVNVDDALVAKAESPGDDFEYLGIANPSPTSFWATPDAVDFSGRLQDVYWDMDLDDITMMSAGLEAFSDPIWVDTTELPLGLGLLDLPIASWHQKMVSIDGEIAYVSGMNLDYTDWDTADHLVFEPRRMEFSSSASARQAVVDKTALPDHPPAKDYTLRVEGPLATDVEAVFSAIWQYQLDNDVLYADLSTPVTSHALASPLSPGWGVVDAQLLFTLPQPFGEYTVLESLLRAIDQAETYIFIQDQYMRAPILAERILARMWAQPDLRVVVITNPIDEWTNPACWQTHIQNELLTTDFPDRFRTYRLRSFDAVDTGCTFCIDEVDATFIDHYLHAKLVIIDDVYLEVGSANHNHRSLLYDAELAVAVVDEDWVHAQRESVTAAFLGSYYTSGMSFDTLWDVMASAANANQWVYDAWDDTGMDLNLNGDPVPSSYIPDGFLYPLSFGAPDDCFIENVGADVTK